MNFKSQSDMAQFFTMASTTVSMAGDYAYNEFHVSALNKSGMAIPVVVLVGGHGDFFVFYVGESRHKCMMDDPPRDRLIMDGKLVKHPSTKELPASIFKLMMECIKKGFFPTALLKRIHKDRTGLPSCLEVADVKAILSFFVDDTEEPITGILMIESQTERTVGQLAH